MFMTFTAALALNYSSTKAIRAIFTFACISAGHFHFITSTATTVIIFITTGSFFSIDTTSTVHFFNCFLLCFLQLWFWYHRIIMTSTHVIIAVADPEGFHWFPRKPPFKLVLIKLFTIMH